MLILDQRPPNFIEQNLPPEIFRRKDWGLFYNAKFRMIRSYLLPGEEGQVLFWDSDNSRWNLATMTIMGGQPNVNP